LDFLLQRVLCAQRFLVSRFEGFNKDAGSAATRFERVGGDEGALGADGLEGRVGIVDGGVEGEVDVAVRFEEVEAVGEFG
jgi:hypothetical protein